MQYGGLLGVRDSNALEAALFRPQTGYYEDLVAEAASLMESLAKNHPFLDGNKRIAWAATVVFMEINGWRFNDVPEQTYLKILQMFESNTFDVAHITPWLRTIAIKNTEINDI
jgi:death on curing protein